MIEIVNKKTDFGGFVDGDKYLRQDMNIAGYLDGNEYKWSGGETLLILKPNGEITFIDGDFAGTLKSGQIFDERGGLLYKFFKRGAKVLDDKGEIALELKGDVRALGDREFFGIVAHFLELFA